jgi:hypothetical protein
MHDEGSMDLTFDELERELRSVEEAIMLLNASDAFVEDLVSRHAYRKALIAALSDRPRKRPQKIAGLASRHKADAIGENDDDAFSRSSR